MSYPLAENLTHDLQGRRTSQTVSSVYNRVYSLFDLNGNVKQLTATGFSGSYVYDTLDRLTQDMPTGFGISHGFNYDGNGNRSLDNTVPYLYAPNSNRLISVGGTAVSYDAAGNIQGDAFGRSYTYDGPGRLKSATVNGIATTYAYNAFGSRTQKARPNTPAVHYHTGLNGELLAETESNGAPIVEYIYADQEPIAQIRYASDPGSAPPTVTGFWPGAGGANTTVFVFGSGFVPGIGGTTVKVNGINAPIMQVLSSDLLFLLLPGGNTNGPITVTTAQGATTSTNAFGTPLSGVQITGLWPAQGPVNTFVFVFGSGFTPGQTVQVNQTPAPIRQVLDTSLFFVMVPNGATTGPIAVTTPQGSASSATPFTVLGTGVPPNTTVTYLHTDHLGTPRAGTDETGKVVWRWEGEACGATVPTGSVTVNLRFPGQYYDKESQLYYNWNRYFDPKTCRYLSSDPIGLAGGLNTFTYANNNPLRWTDPMGLSGVLYTPIDSDKLMGPVVSGARGGAARSPMANPQNVANVPRLADQLKLESAKSPFSPTGQLTPQAIAESKLIMPSGQLNNPAIPAGCSKYSTPTFQSPSGDFQVHFYLNPGTKDVFYGVDYKVIFNVMSGSSK